MGPRRPIHHDESVQNPLFNGMSSKYPPGHLSKETFLCSLLVQVCQIKINECCIDFVLFHLGCRAKLCLVLLSPLAWDTEAFLKPETSGRYNIICPGMFLAVLKIVALQGGNSWNRRSTSTVCILTSCCPGSCY